MENILQIIIALGMLIAIPAFFLSLLHKMKVQEVEERMWREYYLRGESENKPDDNG